MTNEQLTELIDAYVETVVDCMDMEDLMNFASQSIHERLEQMGTEDILAEITEVAPELLTEESEDDMIESVEG